MKHFHDLVVFVVVAAVVLVRTGLREKKYPWVALFYPYLKWFCFFFSPTAAPIILSLFKVLLFLGRKSTGAFLGVALTCH